MTYTMLWYDDDPSLTLEEKIANAANEYETAYLVRPNNCEINPSMTGDGRTAPVVHDINVVLNQMVLKHHFILSIVND